MACGRGNPRGCPRAATRAAPWSFPILFGRHLRPSRWMPEATTAAEIRGLKCGNSIGDVHRQATEGDQRNAQAARGTEWRPFLRSEESWRLGQSSGRHWGFGGLGEERLMAGVGCRVLGVRLLVSGVRRQARRRRWRTAGVLGGSSAFSTATLTPKGEKPQTLKSRSALLRFIRLEKFSHARLLSVLICDAQVDAFEHLSEDARSSRELG